MNKTALIMVLSFDEGYYRSLVYASKQTWDSIEINGIETVFYFGDEGVTSKVEYDAARKNLFTGTGEGLTAIANKNLAAFEWALKNMDFDYLIRVNASMYVDKQAVHEYIQGLPDSDLYMGIGAPFTHEGKEIMYAWGPCITLSRDVVREVVENKDKHPVGMMDDTGLGVLMRELGIPLNNSGQMGSIDIDRVTGKYHVIAYNNPNGGGGEFESVSDDGFKALRMPFVRCKQDWDRLLDIRLFNELFNAIEK